MGQTGKRPVAREVDQAPHGYVYELRGGMVIRHRGDVWKLPEVTRDHYTHACEGMSLYTLRVLRKAARELDRMAPWVTVYVVPGLFRRDIGDDYVVAVGARIFDIEGIRHVGVGGVAYQEHDLVLINGSVSARSLMGTLFHEAWHMVQPHLSEMAHQTINAETSGSFAWPGDYYASDVERQARLFENWAGQRLETSLWRAVDLSVIDAERVFAAFHSGELADQLIRTGVVRVPEATKAARGLVPPPRVPSVGERVVGWFGACLRSQWRMAVAWWERPRREAAILAAHRAWDAAGDDLDAATAALGRLGEVYRA